LHAIEQLLPEARVVGQVPRLPLGGVLTEHELGEQVCVEVRTPREHVVAAPLTV
jgi:hypothetical protein